MRLPAGSPLAWSHCNLSVLGFFMYFYTVISKLIGQWQSHSCGSEHWLERLEANANLQAGRLPFHLRLWKWMSREQLHSQLVPKMDRRQNSKVLERLQPAFLNISSRKKQSGGGSSQGTRGFPSSTPFLWVFPQCHGPNPAEWKLPTAFVWNTGIFTLKKNTMIKLALLSPKGCLAPGSLHFLICHKVLLFLFFVFYFLQHRCFFSTYEKQRSKEEFWWKDNALFLPPMAMPSYCQRVSRELCVIPSISVVMLTGLALGLVQKFAVLPHADFSH